MGNLRQHVIDQSPNASAFTAPAATGSDRTPRALATPRHDIALVGQVAEELGQTSRQDATAKKVVQLVGHETGQRVAVDLSVHCCSKVSKCCWTTWESAVSRAPGGSRRSPCARARDPGTHNGRGHLPWTVHRSEVVGKVQPWLRVAPAEDRRQDTGGFSASGAGFTPRWRADMACNPKSTFLRRG